MIPNGIPEKAKRVFEGVMFDIWQWDQQMYDGGTEVFERAKRKDTATVIPVVGDKILIQVEEQPDKPEPFLSLPGGLFEERESPLACAKREFLEESGYVSDDWVLWKKYDVLHKVVWVDHVFIARNCIFKEEPKLDSGEKITNRFLTFDEFLLLSDDETFRNREVAMYLFRARLDPKIKEEFYKLLFGEEKVQ